MSKIYSVINGAVAGAAAPVKVTTGTAIKTLIQIATNATNNAIRVKQWWIEFDGSTAATPIEVELIRHTGGPDTTLTAYVAGDIAKLNDPNAPATSIQLGAALSGYTATAEVTPTTVSGFEAHLVPPTGGLLIQYPLGQEPEVQVGAFMRIRVTAGAAVNAYCGIEWEE
jgi:hypothetical protein